MGEARRAAPLARIEARIASEVVKLKEQASPPPSESLPAVGHAAARNRHKIGWQNPVIQIAFRSRKTDSFPTF